MITAYTTSRASKVWLSATPERASPTMLATDKVSTKAHATGTMGLSKNAPPQMVPTTTAAISRDPA